ncbi:10931_t:CDS:1, partial [Acaulospora morrowiae]
MSPSIFDGVLDLVTVSVLLTSSAQDPMTVAGADSICEETEASVFCSSISISVLLLGVTDV